MEVFVVGRCECRRTPRPDAQHSGAFQHSDKESAQALVSSSAKRWMSSMGYSPEMRRTTLPSPSTNTSRGNEVPPYDASASDVLVVGEHRPRPVDVPQPLVGWVIRGVGAHGGADADDVQPVGHVATVTPIVQQRDLAVAVRAPVGEEHHHRRSVVRRVDGDRMAGVVEPRQHRHLHADGRVVARCGDLLRVVAAARHR